MFFDSRVLLAIAILGTVTLPVQGKLSNGDAAVANKFESCPSVRFLTPDDDLSPEYFPEDFKDHIVRPYPNQKDVARMAMDALTPFVCSAVNRIAFVKRKNGSARAFVRRKYPDLIIVIATDDLASERRLRGGFITPIYNTPNKRAQALKIWPETVKSIIHEAIHCAVHLIQSVTGGTLQPNEHEYPNAWSSSAKAQANRIKRHVTLRGDLENEWKLINDGFREAGQSSDYSGLLNSLSSTIQERTGFEIGEGVPLEDSTTQAPEGMLSHYGSKSPGEDIAETAAWPLFIAREADVIIGNMPNLGYTVDPPDPVELKPPFEFENTCKSMKQYTGQYSIPSEFVSVYTKLQFLLDLELISRKGLEKCLGSDKIGLKRVSSGFGFQVYKQAPASGVERSFQNQYADEILIRPGFGQHQRWFAISAKGKTKWVETRDSIVHLQILAHRDYLPRPGMYRIKSCNTSHAQFKIVFPGRSWFICAYDAYVLVSRSNCDRLEGAVVLVRYIKGIVPELEDPPILFTFAVNPYVNRC